MSKLITHYEYAVNRHYLRWIVLSFPLPPNSWQDGYEESDKKQADMHEWLRTETTARYCHCSGFMIAFESRQDAMRFRLSFA